MENLSAGYFYNNNLENNAQWSEQYENSNINPPGRLQRSDNIVPQTHVSDEVLNQPPQNNISLKSNSFNGKKCQVYVHHFNKIPSKSSNNYIQNWRSGNQIHQNMYKHECSDFYDSKLRSVKKQFDNLSIQSTKAAQPYSPLRFYKGYNKHTSNERNDRYNYLSRACYAKTTVNGKLDKSILFKPENKAIADKLEESYWAKWKPDKNSTNKETIPRTKGLYTENENINVHCQNANKIETKERGDSNKCIITSEDYEKPSTDNTLVYVDNSCPNYTQANKELQEEEESDALEEKIVVSELDLSNKPTANEENENVDVPKSTVLILETQEDTGGTLKHTDSLILTTKRQHQEKSPYQQPKCIKLFKNADYATTAQTNYIRNGTRGGSYPLKSCLKKQTSQKLNLLGRPGSPIKMGNSHRPGKANRFIK